MPPLSRRYLWTAGALLLGLLLASAPLLSFPRGAVITLEQGMSASGVAELLAAERVVAHKNVLKLIVTITGASSHIQAGTYAFNTPQSAFTIAYRLRAGTYELAPVRLTIPEGMSVREIAERVSVTFPAIAKEKFIMAGKGYEGYLFPDTYFFLPTTDAALIIQTMRETFEKKNSLFSTEIEASGRSLHDIITMASIVEKEGRTTEVRRIVAGILWDRVELGMPLQTDAVFGYIFDRATYHPSLADLKVDSPYNTYAHKGLPPGPINNPGLDSIQAALNPIKTKYLYYLTDREGVMHYAVTFAEHQQNQQKYLR